MPLSTSNSDARMGAGRWGRVWLLAVVLTVSILSGWELFWRLHDFRPSVQDNRDLWAVVRRQASARSDRPVIAIGASRVQTGLVPDVYARATGSQPLMLAIDGTNPLPVLKNLAEDDRISGTVICSFIPMWLGEPDMRRERAAKWIRAYHRQQWSNRVETRLSVLIQYHLVLRYTGILPEQFIEGLQEGHWPRPPYARMLPNRFRPADFSMTDVERVRNGRIEREKEFHAGATPLGTREFKQLVREIDRMVNRITLRGGRVIFLRMPSSGVIRELEARSWPREKYWDVLVSGTEALAYHFEDYPALSAFSCPDGSHLDIRDARIFTERLARMIARTE